MTDIVERLRGLRFVHVPVASDLIREACQEIERLRTLATQATPSEGSVPGEGTKPVPHQTCPHVRGTVTQHCSLNFTLTDAEREAIEWFADVRKPLTRLTQSHNREKYKATLRGLLERTSHGAVPEAKADLPDERPPNAVSANGGTPGAASRDGSGTGNTPSDAEIDALEFVVVMGRVANGWDKDILRQWLIRLRPEFDSAKAIKEGESDRSQPIGSPAKTNPTQPRNGTPVKGSVPGEGSVPDSRNWNEPVAWAVEDERGLQKALHPTAGHARCMARSYRTDGMEGKVVPLYRHPQPTLTDEEREAVEVAIIGGCEMAATLRKLLERLGGER